MAFGTCRKKSRAECCRAINVRGSFQILGHSFEQLDGSPASSGAEADINPLLQFLRNVVYVLPEIPKGMQVINQKHQWPGHLLGDFIPSLIPRSQLKDFTANMLFMGTCQVIRLQAAAP